MPVNTAYLNTAGAPTGVSNQSQIAGSQATFVNVRMSVLTATGAAALSGTVALSGQVNSTATVNFNSVTNRFLSKVTTASLTSLTLADGEFTLGAHSANSIVLYYRSGATTYQWANSAGGVL